MSKKIHNILLERSLEQHRSLNDIFTKNGVIFLKKSKNAIFDGNIQQEKFWYLKKLWFI